jgi:hypothetical protein
LNHDFKDNPCSHYGALERDHCIAGAKHAELRPQRPIDRRQLRQTAERNQAGRIDPGRVLDALAEAGAQAALLVLEVIPAFEQDDAEALADLRASAELWQAALTEGEAR